MRPHGAAEELEARRMLAARLSKQGKGPTEIAGLLGVSRRSAQDWVSRYRRGGEQALRKKAHRGPRPKLTARQRKQLARALLKGPKKHGFPTDLWTCRRVGQLIWRLFRVKFHQGHVWRILQSLGWSAQKPQRRAYERDEEAVARWVKKDWPRIKKSP